MEAGVMERRHSTDSNDSSNCSKQGDETSGGVRVLKPTSVKPPANAFQFVKTGPCDLYRKAQEQIKKAQQIKKEKQTMRNDTEEWQSNLDNWKSSRRKMQEHIIERVVEVKKFELEEHERSRRRSKTFSEMMQERGRKASIPVYDDSSANDFSDLGLSSNSDKLSNENSSVDDSNSDTDNNKVVNGDEIDLSNGATFVVKTGEKVDVEKLKRETASVKKESTGEKEEYTYERAIQNYVNFAETRVKSLSARSIPEEVKTVTNGPSKDPPPVPAKPKRASNTKTDLFSKVELYRKSVSTTDLTESNKKVAVPKVDISKRRELFEKIEPESKSSIVSRSSVDLNSSRSIKERLSFLEKNNENNKNKSLERPSPEISVKERLSNLENFKRPDGQAAKLSKPGELGSTSIKDRLTNLEKSKANTVKQAASIDASASIKDRLSSLHSACNKEISKSVLLKPNSDFHEKLNTFQEIEASTEEVYPLSEDTGYSYSSEDLFEAKKSRHYRHRSLDSLDVDDGPVSNETFERVQSYEDLDYRNYPASSLSGDTDREDSGIHTADVSSSVSQADDFDLHLDSNLSDDIKIAHQHPVSMVAEELKSNESKSPTELPENVSCLKFEVPEPSPTPRAYTKLDCSSPLPAILENPAEFNSSVDIPVVNTYGPFNRPTHSSHGNVDDLEPFPSYKPADLSSRSEFHETDTVKLEPRTSLPSDCDNTVIEVCEQIYTPEEPSSQLFSTLNAHSSNDFKNFNGFDGKDISNSSDVTLVEIEEINDSEVLEKDSVLEEEQTVVEPFKELPAQSDIVSTTNQIIALHSRDQSTDDFIPVVAPKIKEIPPPIPTDNEMDCSLLDMTVVSESGSVFPLSPTALEPPKEKPPPPPTENSDDDLDDMKTGSMRRMDSAKRIKKEIRLKRSSFLGLDGTDNNYIDPEVELTRPPDLTALLTEERRLERQLYRQSLCSETDSNQESRDSGVELDNKTSDTWVSHSRTNSDNFGNQSTTSEEDDIMKKEREIIETLEQEERIRKQQLGEKLAMRLRELEAVEKDSLEWQRLYDGVDINQIEKSDNHTDIEGKDNFGRDMEKVTTNGEGMWYDHSSDTESVREPGYLYSPSPPVPPHRTQQAIDRQYDMPFNMAERQFQPHDRRVFQMAERQAFQPPERQTFQQVERQDFQPEERMNFINNSGRQNCLPPERQFQQASVQQPLAERAIYHNAVDRQQLDQSVHYQQPVQRRIYTGSLHHDKNHNHPHHPGAFTLPYRSSYNDLSRAQPADLKEVHRRSMPELQALTRRSVPDPQLTTSKPVPDHRRPPPPALPAKPNHLSTSSQQTPQPMTRTTKQALSAAPRSRLISNESWQAKRKPKQENCNYQHWLIQEAEHRRITEQQKRQSGSGIRQQAANQPPPPPLTQPLQNQQWPGHKPIYTSTPAPPQWTSHSKREKPLPDSIIQTLTQRVQNRKPDPNNNRRSVHRYENVLYNQNEVLQEKVLSVSGKKRCSACGEELGRGAAMIIESLQLFYHIDCFKCCVCCMQLGDGLMGTDVRVRNNKLHCHNCYSSDDGAKFSCV